MKRFRKILALGAFFVGVVALSGCGSGVPGNAVADMSGNGVFEIDGQTIHFIHVVSPEPGALPLILTHGWPSSFADYLEIRVFHLLLTIFYYEGNFAIVVAETNLHQTLMGN